MRIWPLYFLIIGLALFVLPSISLFTMPGYGKEVVYHSLRFKIILYLCFLPNLVGPFFGVIPYAAHTWSIGTEEQYYLIWPLILKYIKKHRLMLMALVVLMYLFISQLLDSSYTNFIPCKRIIAGFWYAFNIDCMAIGGFFAIILFQKSKCLKFFLTQYLFYAVLLLTSLLILKGVSVPYIHNEFYALLFGILILNFAANRKIGISLEIDAFKYLGKISYGLYMYHPIGIVMSIKLALMMHNHNPSNWLLYPLTLFITISLSAISYRYFESPFLKLKSQFSSVASGGG